MTAWHTDWMAAFDLETTGTDPETARIVTATIVHIKGAQTETQSWLVNPGIEIPAEAAAIHGVTTERARAEGIAPATAAALILAELDQAWTGGHPDCPLSVRGPLGYHNRRIAASTYWQFGSAAPYTVTTGVDTNGDGIFNERVAGVGRNGSRGFAQFYQGAHLGWNLPKGVAAPGTQPKYRMQIWIEADNVWNRVNRTVVSGVLTSPYFGQAIAASQPRRLYFGISATL